MAGFQRGLYPENTATGVSTEFTQPGKTYGSRGVGDVSGRLKTYGDTVELVYEITSDTSATGYYTQIIGDNEYLVDELVLEVSEAFDAASTANISIDGGAGLTTPLDLATQGISKPALTGLANTAGQGPVEIVFSPNATTQASAAGKAELVVKYRRV